MIYKRLLSYKAVCVSELHIHQYEGYCVTTYITDFVKKIGGKKMKRTSAIITALLLTITFTLPASARDIGLGRGRMFGNRGPQMGNRPYQGIVRDNLTNEQRKKIEDAYKAFLDETTDLRNNLRTKHTELTNLLSTADPDAEKAKALQKEISDLQAKLAQKRLELRLEILKINPDARYRQWLGRRNMMRFADPE